MMNACGLTTFKGDRCAFQGEPITAHGVTGYIKTPTGWATNSEEIGRRLARECKGGHEHVPLFNGVSKLAQAYSKRLVGAVLSGLSAQLKIRKHCDAKVKPQLAPNKQS